MQLWRNLIRQRKKAKDDVRLVSMSGAEPFDPNEILNYNLIKEMEFLDDVNLQIRK